MKLMWKMPYLLVMVVLLTVGMGFSANAADVVVEKKPYEYDFVANTGNLYNGFKGAKDLVITFDKNIQTVALQDISVEQVYSDTISKNVEILAGITVAGNKLSIKFKNLEFLDQSAGTNFILTIKEKKLYPEQLTAYEFPFKLYDMLPGFDSTFLDPFSTDSEKINNNIFKQNEPRAVKIHVPPLYITKIETIHRNTGVVADKEGPSLSSIDVLANAEATRLKVNFNQTPNSNQFDRDLDRSSSKLNGFSMGQAGINEVCVTGKPVVPPVECLNKDEFTLKSFSASGRLLATNNLKMEVKDRLTDFKVSNYIKASEKVFGKEYTIYDLMASPKILNDIMAGIAVKNLNQMGVTYSLGDIIQVFDETQLKMALENESFKTIRLAGNINLTSDLLVKRSVKIEGFNPETEIAGANVILGEGTTADLTIYLKNLKVMDTIEVNVGAKGTAVLSDTTATNTIVKSGGVNSVHLINYKSNNAIVLNNAEDLRIVTNSNILPSLIINGTGKLILEGKYQDVKVNNTTGSLTMRNNTVINKITNSLDSPFIVSIPNSMVVKPEIEGTNVEFILVEDNSSPGTEEPNLYIWDQVRTVEIKKDQTLASVIDLSEVIDEKHLLNSNAIMATDWKIKDYHEISSPNIRVKGKTLEIKNDVSELVNLVLVGLYNGETYEIKIKINIIINVIPE